MFLKRITVCGFKSFSDKVDFDFGAGVTCIVGPNGCGKSNIVDAFKWVLGEQSARTLRGRQMTDMIFNGSATRRSSSVARVDLLWDNSDRALPLDQDDVTVTRKLYRSGESEYLLNNHASRLKDIRELFMDTGVGADAYSIIEQGRVEMLLQTGASERRVIFEEAAGISKFKARRNEAERKLQRMEQNLLRVDDIVEEVEKRLRSVRLQAGKARNYREYETRLNALRSRFAMAEYHRFSEQISALSRQVDQLGDRLAGLRTEIERNETNEAQLGVRVDEITEEINQADNELVRARSLLAAQEERIVAARRRSEEQRSLSQRARERKDADARRLLEGEQELIRVRESAVALQQESAALHARIKDQTEQDTQYARDLTEAQAELDDEKAGLIELVRQSAQIHNEIVRLNTHRESLQEQQGRLAERRTSIQGELEHVLRQKSEFERRVKEIIALAEAQSRKLEEKKAESARVDAVRQQLVDALASTKDQRTALQSRQEILRDLERNMEGVGAGVRFILEAAAAPDAPTFLDGLLGLAADTFTVDVEHAGVIAAALGDREQWLIIDRADPLLGAREMRDDLAGRTTVLALDRLPPIVNERDFSDQAGFVARAIDLVRVEPAHERVCRYLLAKTIVVESTKAAMELARGDVHGHRFVALNGTVVEPDGRVVMGPHVSAAGLISRKSELQDIDQRLEAIDNRIATLADQLNRTQAEVGHLDAVQQELRRALYECNTAQVEANAGLQGVRDSVERLTNEQPLIAHELGLIEHQLQEVASKREDGDATLERIERENEIRQAQTDAHQRRIDEIVDDRRRLQEELTRIKVHAGQLTEKRAAAAASISTLQRSVRELQESVATANDDVEQCEARAAEAMAAAAQGEQECRRLTSHIEQCEGICSRLRSDRDTQRLELDGLSQASKASRRQVEAVEQQRHTHEMSLAEANVRRDDLAARTRDELGIDLADDYAQYEHEEQDWDAVEADMAELRGKMDRLGNVNLNAIDELEELENRHTFLTAQRDDLTDSRRQLQQLIEKLNREARERFISSFSVIRDNFRSLFRKLFGGGKADIILEDEDDVLECGIEIVARPPGKELQSISLMSGGEKSMTAIALLMSIFQSRPSPCALLDEVDAALDEANNERFNRIIKEFVTGSQFVIITHSKRTMSVADQLYGITMQEPGVSTRMSVQLRDAGAA